MSSRFVTLAAAGLLFFACYEVVDEGGGARRDAGTGSERDGAADAGADPASDSATDPSDLSDASDDATDAGTWDAGWLDSGEDTGGDAGSDAGLDDAGDAASDPCANHCFNQKTDCGESGVDCGGDCAACADPCAGHCSNQQMDCGEVGVDCGGGCGKCPETCDGHCTNQLLDCGESGVDCGGDCAACPDPCTNHCSNLKADCGEAGVDCGGECSACGSGGCSFPQGVPDGDFTPGTGNDATIAAAINSTMAGMSGCNVGSDCYIGDQYPDAQQWFVAVAQALRDQGFCAGQHELGYTDEIAVSNTGCTGRWYGYHIFNYGGSKVVWNPGAQRGWWSIDPKWCAGR